MDMTIQELAEYARGFFEGKKRGEGDSAKHFYTPKRTRPVWVMEMVREAHDDKLPDDFTYETIVEVLDLLSEGNAPDDLNLEPDVYNHDLIEWLGSHGHRPAYVDEAVEDYGHSPQGILGDIMLGQAREKDEIKNFVVSALEKRLEDPADQDAMENDERASRANLPEDWDPRNTMRIKPKRGGK